MKSYSIHLAQNNDINSWMDMVEIVKDNFPGLETEEQLEDHKKTIIKNIKRGTAICAKKSSKIIGILLFSYNSHCLSCMAVHPDYRRKGIASAMVEKMLDLFPANIDISVITFRGNDQKGIAPRAFYKKYGFIEDELVEEHGYPQQKLILHRK